MRNLTLQLDSSHYSAQLEKSLLNSEDPAQPQINKIIYIYVVESSWGFSPDSNPAH